MTRAPRRSMRPTFASLWIGVVMAGCGGGGGASGGSAEADGAIRIDASSDSDASIVDSASRSSADSSDSRTADAGAASDADAASPKQLDLAEYVNVIRFDGAGENGVPYGDGKLPFGPSVGYPAGVPNSYNWKFQVPGGSTTAVPTYSPSRSAGAAYDQIYQHRPGDAPAANARILLEPIEVYGLSKSTSQWTRLERVKITGAAFAEDFLDNESTGADARDEAGDSISVRSGSNAAGGAGGVTGRTAEDGPVGYLYHGFDHRFEVIWSDLEAILVVEIMSCIPQSGGDLSDCARMPYIANVGLDSWATTSSAFDGFKTHGGVSGGRFKPVTIARQIFTNYVGPDSILDTNPPPLPGGF